MLLAQWHTHITLGVLKSTPRGAPLHTTGGTLSRKIVSDSEKVGYFLTLLISYETHVLYFLDNCTESPIQETHSTIRMIISSHQQH
jgi:hypothetical protein